MSVDMDTAIAELTSKVAQMPGAENKLTMIVMSGDLDKHLAAMIIATGAAAMGMKVVMFFTFWGTPALRAPQKRVAGKTFMGKMFGMMLPKGRNKLVLSKMHMMGMGTAMMKGLMKKKNVASLDEMYDVAAQLSVKIYACQMSMDLMGFRKEELIDYPGLEVCGVATMLSHAKESSIQFFI
ncbi:MAG: DsrE/DsrF/DrsH-like family protein [Spirochaetia bacterium]